ncbi:XRE family transcriptional regulator [Verrucomicrobium sp. 3C]|uniref:XRE family transcriptional regulator n=1 Tax=Verrucomicrobium sp. 3C TaxID=1134055 RepID=UPI00037A875B|nr:XRE family transcriptional regulator [Verrucomicrobium sp. 3C]
MSDIIARRLKCAREKKGWTQAQLASRFGFKDRQTLAAVEAGKRKITADELVRAMDIFGVEIEFFTDSMRLVGEGSFNWRASREASADLLDQFEDRAGRWIALYRKLGEKAGKTTSPLQPRLVLSERSSFEDAWSAAEALTGEWQLGEIPALRLESAIKQRLGALVLYVDAPAGISGAACQLPGLNTILINRNEPEGRRHFDLAHESFHLLTWEQMTPEHKELADGDYCGKGRQKRIEQLADNFAGTLLMPRHMLAARRQSRAEDRDLHEWLNETATELCVSAQSLKWRLFYLGLLSKADLMDIDDRKLTANGRPMDKQPKPHLFSAEFAQRLHAGLLAGDLSARRAGSLLGMTFEDLTEFFESYELPVPFDL